MGTIVDRNYNETEVVFGHAPAGTPEETKDACSNINWVRNDINEIKSQFIRLGFHLEEISRCEIYKIFGFDDFYEFCEANFHLSRSTVSRHINLFLRFCHKNGKYETPTMFIDERWKDYNYSQLCEMLPLPDQKLEGVNPKMTVKEIREYKAGLKNKACDKAKNEKCSYNSDYICNIEKVIKEHFFYRGNITDCAGCCSCCLYKEKCEYVCDFVKSSVLCDVAQTEPLPEPETCEDDVEDFIYENIKRRRQEIMQNVYDLKNFIDRKNYSMASVSVNVLCGRLKSLFGV